MVNLNAFASTHTTPCDQQSPSRSGGSPALCAATRRDSGFSLVELMVGLVLASILMSIGLPMFRGFIGDQRLRATTADLRIALTTARSEAVKRNRVVQLQPIDADKGWGGGWTIASPTPGDPDILNFQQRADVTITTTPDVAALQFTPMGRAATVVEFAVDVGPPESSTQGCMQLELDGRITSRTGACQGG